MRHLLLACALIPALAFPVFAEDAPAAPAKAEKKAEAKAIPFAKVAATWPKPAADHAFETQLVLLIGEERAGTARHGTARLGSARRAYFLLLRPQSSPVQAKPRTM